MHLVDALPPNVDRGKVSVEEGQVQRTERIRAPREINHGTSGEVNRLDPHASHIVQRIHQALNVPSMPQLSARQVMFPRRAIDIVIMRVAVDESIEHDSIEGESPVVW